MSTTLGLGLGANRIASDVSINPVVLAFAESNGITDPQEIRSLNALYVGLTTLVSAHGGTIRYLNGVSPTSLAAAREAIIYTTGNQTAVELGTDPIHSNDGVEFDGSSQGWNIGNITNGLPQDEIFCAFSRTNTISVIGVSMGFNDYIGSEDMQMSVRPTPSPCGYCKTNNYTSGQDFSGPGSWIGYNNGTTTALWLDGSYQTPDSNNAPSAAALDAVDTYVACRNNAGAANFVDDRMSLILVIHDGGTLFSQAQIEAIDQLMFDYNATVV